MQPARLLHHPSLPPTESSRAYMRRTTELHRSGPVTAHGSPGGERVAGRRRVPQEMSREPGVDGHAVCDISWGPRPLRIRDMVLPVLLAGAIGCQGLTDA